MSVNNARIVLDQDFSSQATSITLPAGTGAILGDSFPLKITYEFFDYNKNVISREILNITSRNGDNIVVQRAVEKCPVSDFVFTQTQTPQELKKGGILEVRVTAGEIDGKANLSGGNTFSGIQKINGDLYFQGGTRYIDNPDGQIRMRTKQGMHFFLDYDNNSGSESFTINKDQNSFNSPVQRLFTVGENGNIGGYGITSPQYRLHIAGDNEAGGFRLQRNDGSKGFHFWAGAVANIFDSIDQELRIRYNGNDNIILNDQYLKFNGIPVDFTGDLGLLPGVKIALKSRADGAHKIYHRGDDFDVFDVSTGFAVQQYNGGIDKFRVRGNTDNNAIYFNSGANTSDASSKLDSLPDNSIFLGVYNDELYFYWKDGGHKYKAMFKKGDVVQIGDL